MLLLFFLIVDREINRPFTTKEEKKNKKKKSFPGLSWIVNPPGSNGIITHRLK